MKVFVVTFEKERRKTRPWKLDSLRLLATYTISFLGLRFWQLTNLKNSWLSNTENIKKIKS